MTLPLAYQIRLAVLNDAKAITYVHVQSWRESYQGMIDKEFLDSISYERRLVWRKKSLREKRGFQFVATFNDKVVGFCVAAAKQFHKDQKLTPEQILKRDEKGEIGAIYLLKEHQGKGIGKALLNCSLLKLRQEGLLPIIVWALKANIKACAFYESQGGALVDEVEALIGDKFYLEVGYRFL